MRVLNQRAQAARVGDEKSPREKILDELKTGTGDKDRMNEELEEFVRNRATPVDHYLLFRYLDIKVEPGKTYRYRVKLVVTNPFKERRIEEVTDPSIIEGAKRRNGMERAHRSGHGAGELAILRQARRLASRPSLAAVGPDGRFSVVRRNGNGGE